MSHPSLLDLLDPKFPLVYQGILPKEQNFQMTKAKLSRECAICERPFSVFFWRRDNVPFRTQICQICAKTANVCQVSLLDLDFGIPVIVRNKLLHMQQEDYKSSNRRWYNNRILDRRIDEGEDWLDGTFRERILRIDPVAVTMIQKFVQQDPYLSFRKAPVCMEWLANECIHGSSCYYSHELPKPGDYSPDYSKFGVRGRYLGTVDPNGQAIIEKLLLVDQAFFSKKEQKNDDENEKVEKKINQSKQTVNIRHPMTAPSYNKIFDDNDPLPFDGMEYNENMFPKFVNGKLQIQ